jgi:hypothetical protein
MTMKKTILAVTALAILLAPAARAQDASVLGAGTRVRLAGRGVDSAQQIGKVVSATRDSIVFRADAYPVTRTVAVADLSSIEISGGQATHRGRDALYGLAIGGGVGAIAGAASYKRPKSCYFLCDTRSSDAIAGALLGGLVGSVVGAFIVGTVDKTERWIPLRGTKLGIAPAAGGIRLALSREF